VLPSNEYDIQDHPPEHPFWRAMFQIERLPQIPAINHWYSSDGETSERGPDSAETHIRGISDKRGRLMVLMTHNTDISDAWEREGEDPRYFYLFSPNGYAVGINVVMYAMTH
jgi:phosphoribosylformylglycinamidine (FGAM) synthase-like amidotransferase family enzyme